MGYLNHAQRFRMFPFAGAAVRQLNEAGLAVIVVTNQSGVGRGYFPESVVHEVHEVLRRELAAAGAHLDGIYYCPHRSADRCDCRKPKTGMLERAVRELGVDVQRSFVVGDRYRDIELAHRAGARGILVRSGYGLGEVAWHAKEWPRQPDQIVDDLRDAVNWILREER
jgi:D-glycero-D-manno-heptose 1,7-bisphosphate phosphatase